MDDILLKIAGFHIRLVNLSNRTISLDEGYADFIVPRSDAPEDLRINVHETSSFLPSESVDTIYSATLNGDLLWRIVRANHGNEFHVFDPNDTKQLLHIAHLDQDLSEWNIHSRPKHDTAEMKLMPLEYPMGPLIMYYLTVKFQAIMIHGSGVAANGKARIFTGVSGKGKTTMARLWYANGAEVLNDDRLIIRKEAEGYFVYNTPMFYQDTPRRAKLHSICSIHHSEKNTIAKLDGAVAVSALSANIIQHGYDQRIITHHLEFLAEMISTIGVFSVGFVPEPSIVVAIKEHEA